MEEEGAGVEEPKGDADVAGLEAPKGDAALDGADEKGDAVDIPNPDGAGAGAVVLPKPGVEDPNTFDVAGFGLPNPTEDKDPKPEL